MRDTCLNDDVGPQMTGKAPNRSHKRGITIIPALETFWTNPNAFSFQFSHDFRP